MTYLLGVLELAHERVVVALGDALREAGGRLDVGLEVALQQLVDGDVVVVVVTYAEHAVDVVANRRAERRRVDVGRVAHPVDTSTRHDVAASNHALSSRQQGQC